MQSRDIYSEFFTHQNERTNKFTLRTRDQPKERFLCFPLCMLVSLYALRAALTHAYACRVCVIHLSGKLIYRNHNNTHTITARAIALIPTYVITIPITIVCTSVVPFHLVSYLSIYLLLVCSPILIRDHKLNLATWNGTYITTLILQA